MEVDFSQGVGTPNSIEKEIRFSKMAKVGLVWQINVQKTHTHKILLHQGTMFHFLNSQEVLKIISRLGEVNKIFS